MKDHSRLRKRNRPALAPDDFKRRRRERRMKLTLHSEGSVRGWGEKHGFVQRVPNDAHHWIVRDRMSAEWWPSWAKLALNHDYLRTYHAPHWPDVISVLEPSRPSEKSARARTRAVHEVVPELAVK